MHGMEWKKDKEETQLVQEMQNKNNRGRLWLGQATAAGAWLTVVPDLLNRTTLSAEDFQEKLRIKICACAYSPVANIRRMQRKTHS